MAYEFLLFIVSLSGVIIMLLLTILGYFLRKMMTDQKDTNDALTSSINSLNLTIKGIQVLYEEKDKTCNLKHAEISRTFEKLLK